MGSEEEYYPKIIRVSHTFGEGVVISGILLNFDNVLTIYIYQGNPRTGSMVMVSDDGISTLSLFSGRHEGEAEALGRILARKLRRGVTLSVYFDRYFQLPVGGFEPLIDKLVSAYGS